MGKHIRTARSRPASRRAHSEESTGWREQLATVARAALGTGAVVVLAVLAILAGALLAVHGPGSGGAAQSPSRQVTLGPPPKAKAPAAQPKHKTDNRTPKARPGAAKTARPKTVVLVPGDTLYGLANKHHTTVKTLQRLNKLGSSTLIYAGDTLRLPGTVAGAAEEPASAGGKTGPPTPKHTTNDTDDDSGEKAADKPAMKHSKGRAAKAIAYARAQLGKPYVWGGTGPRGYDCSGLTMRAWQAAGITLPRTTWSQRYAGKATTRAALVPGDLVLAYGDGHVALYIGGGKVIHAPRPGSTVTIALLPPAAQTTGYRHIAGGIPR